MSTEREYCLNCGYEFTWPVCTHCGNAYSTKDTDIMNKQLPMWLVWIIIILLMVGIFGFVYMDVYYNDHSYILSLFL